MALHKPSMRLGEEISMSTKPIVLRQHIRGLDSAPETTLSLSLGEQEISYTIIVDHDQLTIINGNILQPRGSAMIHTRNGSVCVESLREDVRVQSIASGFDGTSANGIMRLQVSDLNRRVYYQLHPGESLFVGSFTISIVPEEHRSLPVSPSGYDSFRERVSQQVSQLQSISPGAFSTPVHNRVWPSVSSPAEIRSIVTQTETSIDNREWPSDHAKPSLLGVMRSFSRTHHAELLDSRGEVTLMTESPSAPDATARTRLAKTKVKFGVQSDFRVDSSNTWMRLKEEQLFNEQRKSIHQRGFPPPPPPMNFEGSGVARKEYHHHVEEKIDDELERIDYVGSATISTPGLIPRKRQRLNSPIPNSFEEETQDSIRSNIVVLEPDSKCKEVTQEGITDEIPFLQEKIEAPVLQEEQSQGRSERPLPESVSREVFQQNEMKANLNPPHTTENTVKILFASSTSINDSKPLMRFLKKQGVEEVFTVDHCNALCVSKSSELKKTSKLILAVLQGKSVITDDWVIRSASAEKLLDMEKFRASDPAREIGWGINLDEAIKRSKHTNSKPFDGWIVVFTSAAKKDAGTSVFHELKEIALYAGAKTCSAALPKKPQEECQPTLIIACPNDPASALLKGPWRCFSRDIIGLSSLRGKLDIDSDEFLVRSDSKSKGRNCQKRK